MTYNLLLLLTMCITSTSEAQEQPRYPQNPGGMEILADAPWRVSSPTSKIPIEVVIKDASSVSPCTPQGIYLSSITIHDGMTNKVKKAYLYGDEFIGETYWEKTYEELTVADFKKDLGNNILIKVVVNYWHYTSSCIDVISKSFTQYLRVYIGEELPHLPSWFCGDTHYHSEFTGDIHASGVTDEVTEFGGNLEMTVKAAKAIGLDWTCVTDHAYYLDDANEWDACVAKINNISSNNFNIILGEEVSPRKMSNEGCTVHLLVYGTNGNYIVGDEHSHLLHGHEHKVNLDDVLSNVTDYGGFAFGAHPLNPLNENVCGGLTAWLTHLWRPWDDADYNTASQHSSFVGLQFWNERKTCENVALGPEWPSQIPTPPYPYNNNYNKDWADELLSGVKEWDKQLIKLLKDNPPQADKKLFMIGGSDAHGHFNYTIYQDTYRGSYYQNNNAFGKVKTYVYCPGGNTEANILYALRNGHSIVTDGPLVIFGIDKNGDKDIDDNEDVIIGEDTELASGEKPTFLIEWESTKELGEILYIDILRGDSSNIRARRLSRISPPEGKKLDGSIEYQDSTVQPNMRYYYRIKARTIKLNKKSPYYPYCRVYTNPIWVSTISPSSPDTSHD